jgi:hypothetical protein
MQYQREIDVQQLPMNSSTVETLQGIDLEGSVVRESR